MYAAAGGASLASRSRQRQRQQNNKNKALQAKLAKSKVSGTATPTRVQASRQFHQLPSTYLRTPQAEARKLSANYATQSKLLLPIVEGNNQQHVPHHHHHHDPHGRPLSPKLAPRHDRLQHLKKSATATFPLHSQADGTPPTTPQSIICSKHPSTESGPNLPSQIPLPQHDSIIVTPATPTASPGHHPAPDDASTGQLERKCSFYRVRRSDAFDRDDNYSASAPGQTITTQSQGNTEESLIYGLPNGGSGHKWPQITYCEQETCTCDHCEQANGAVEEEECAQGRAAWLERGRRCSVQDNNPASCHRRWVKRNRIQDSSLGGSSDDEDLLGVLRGPSSFANAFLYVGLGTIAIGLVIAFVGTGEKGFKTVELRLIGPSLIGIGLVCCILRICFCICPSHCISSSRRINKKNINKIDADHTTSLLRGENKRVSIAKGPHLQRFPLTHKRGNNKMLNEGMEALRQIATTSLFLQNEQKPTANRVVPIIKEPERPAEEAPLEMKKLESPLNVYNISDDEDDEEDGAFSYSNQTECLVQSQSKLARQRVSLNQQQQLEKDCEIYQGASSLLMETSLMIINPPVTVPLSVRATIASSSSMYTYDLPSPTPHQYPRIEQHTPGQVVDTSQSLQLPPALTPTLPSPSAGSQINMRASEGLLTSASPNINLLSPSEPELVLSPAKLGQ